MNFLQSINRYWTSWQVARLRAEADWLRSVAMRQAKEYEDQAERIERLSAGEIDNSACGIVKDAEMKEKERAWQ